MSVLDAALRYTRRGWSVIPVPFQAKNPGFKEWERLRLTEADLPSRFNGQSQNIGVLTGEPSGWLIDVDLDHSLAVELAPQFLPETPCIFGRKSRRRSHWLYRVATPLTTKKFKSKSAGMIVEVRSTGCQTVLPPSVHESGELIEWEDEAAEPPLIDPAVLMDRAGKLVDAVKVRMGEKADPKKSRAKPSPTAVPGDVLADARTLRCLAAMSGMDMEDHKDGSARLYAAACRAIEHDLDDRGAVLVIRQYAKQQPFPKEWTDEEILQRIRHADQNGVERGSAVKPVIVLPSGHATITEAATELAKQFAPTEKLFVRGTSVSALLADRTLRTVNAAALAGLAERVVRFARWTKREGEYVLEPTYCNESNARLILNNLDFLSGLPSIKVLLECPILIEREGRLIELCGYDSASEIYAYGEPTPELSLEEACQCVRTILAGFQYATASDKSRAAAAILSPAFAFGGLLGSDRVPFQLNEADQSQSGKGFQHKIVAEVYRSEPKIVTQRKGGVGGQEENFDTALVRGRPFISWDNLRGKIDVPALESFATETNYTARTPYSAGVEVDPRRFVIMLTSNRMETEGQDLPNRCSIVRIRKWPDGHNFLDFPEGSILDHVKANQPRFLGAVFALIRAWHADGKQKTDDHRHDFRRWCQVMDWIVQRLLGLAPLMDGHTEAKERLSSRKLTWLRDLAIAVHQAGKTGIPLVPHEVAEILDDASLPVPGLKEGMDREDEQVWSQVNQQVGRKLSACFQGGIHQIVVDDITVTRASTWDSDKGRDRHHYQFDVAENSSDLPGVYPSHPPDAPHPPDVPPDKSRDSPDPPEGLELFRNRGNEGQTEDTHENQKVNRRQGDQGGSGGNDCVHDWQDTPTHDGRIRASCRRCGAFRGYRRDPAARKTRRRDEELPPY